MIDVVFCLLSLFTYGCAYYSREYRGNVRFYVYVFLPDDVVRFGALLCASRDEEYYYERDRFINLKYSAVRFDFIFFARRTVLAKEHFNGCDLSALDGIEDIRLRVQRINLIGIERERGRFNELGLRYSRRGDGWCGSFFCLCSSMRN